MADRAGFEGFYREHLPRIVRACALVLLDRGLAEELAAEAFARLWSRWGQIQSDDHAGGYVFTTAMRLCSKRAKSGRRETTTPAPERAGTDEAASAAERTDVWRALATLSVRQRQTVVLRDWAGYETKELAEMLGIRESTARVHLARGREGLRRSLVVEERT